jgi:Ig-like domain from next to BRCA1 gene
VRKPCGYCGHKVITGKIQATFTNEKQKIIHPITPTCGTPFSLWTNRINAANCRKPIQPRHQHGDCASSDGGGSGTHSDRNTSKYTATNLNPTAIPYIESCYNAAFVSDLTIKDDTVLMLGETFKKIWRIQNTGTCAWKEDFAMTFFSGTSMDGLTSPINQYVAPGKIAKISVPMTAPKTEGTYTGYWILSTSDGTKFGQVVYVRIITSKEETTEEPE